MNLILVANNTVMARNDHWHGARMKWSRGSSRQTNKRRDQALCLPSPSGSFSYGHAPPRHSFLIQRKSDHGIMPDPQLGL